MAEEILTEGEGQIKAMVTIAGNPVLSTPNGKKLAKALKNLEFMVAIDIYINETTQYADIILPSTTGLETSHYDLVFHQLAIRNTAKYSEALFGVSDDQKHDWEILNALTKGMDEVGRRYEEKEYYLTDLLEVAVRQKVKIHNLLLSPKEAVGINTPHHLQLIEKFYESRR